MSLFSLLNGRNYGVYNRSVAKLIGLKVTVFLSELLDKYEYHLGKNELVSLKEEEGLWFYVTVDDMEERTTLGEKEQRSCIDHLVELGFIKKVVAGQPAKRYFQIQEREIHDFMIIKINSTSSSQRAELVPPKGQTRSSQKEELDPPKGRNSHIYKEPNKEPKEKEAPEVPMYVSDFTSIKLTLEDFNKLIEDYGEQLILQKIKDLDEYAHTKPKKFKEYGSHYHVILNWLRRDGQSKLKDSPPDWIERLKEKTKNHRDIFIGENSIVFSGGVSQIEIKFTDFSYQEQIKNRLRKMNISIEGL